MSEDIYVAADGTPVIAVQSNALVNTVTLSRRTLDGKAWPLTYEYWLEGAYLQPRRKPSGLVQLPLEWSGYGERIIGGTDGRHPPAAWYVVRDDQSDAQLLSGRFRCVLQTASRMYRTQRIPRHRAARTTSNSSCPKPTSPTSIRLLPVRNTSVRESFGITTCRRKASRPAGSCSCWKGIACGKSICASAQPA